MLKLLQYHPESNSLMMRHHDRKAYYYEDENLQAERKFNEIIQRISRRLLRRRGAALLAYAQYRMNTREDAMNTARAVV